MKSLAELNELEQAASATTCYDSICHNFGKLTANVKRCECR